MRRAPAALAIAWLVLVAGCERGHEHGPAGHASHGEAEEHDHGARTVAMTLWSDRHEIYAEHEPFAVGREVTMAAHLTRLRGFEPATDGTVTVDLVQSGGSTVSARATAPSSPGIFRVALTPTQAGPCTLRIDVGDGGTGSSSDVLVAPACAVLADASDAAPSAGEEPPDGITFLKEQQWRTEFSTTQAREEEIRPGLVAAGSIVAAAGRDAAVTSPSDGRLVLAEPPPAVGMAVTKGQALATLVPRVTDDGKASVEAELRAARAELAEAKSRLARAERLHADGAAPKRQVEEARRDVEVARARVQSSAARLSQYEAGTDAVQHAGNALPLRAPLDGTLVTSMATSGENVQEGQLLFRVIDLSTVWLEAHVFEPDIPRVESATSASFTVAGYEEPFVVDERDGRRITVGHVVDPTSRTVPVVFELTNPAGRLRIGQAATVSIATGGPLRAVVIPESAIVDEEGQPVAYVQLGGETFARRPLRLGVRAGGKVQVEEGIAPGERVVTRGAYQVRLASASGAIPAHGHAH